MIIKAATCVRLSWYLGMDRALLEGLNFVGTINGSTPFRINDTANKTVTYFGKLFVSAYCFRLRKSKHAFSLNKTYPATRVVLPNALSSAKLVARD